ncbi:MAG: class I SAM-dependent methyltransferase [Actinomycetota bacterium]
MLRSAYRSFAQGVLTPELIRKEHRSWERARPPNERAVEYGFALNQLARLVPRTVLDVGPGESSWPDLLATAGFRVRAIDLVEGYWSGGYFNPHWRVRQDDITAPTTAERFGAVTCLSVLEHIPDHLAAVRGMASLLEPGGHVILTCPYNENHYESNVYALPGARRGATANYVCQMFSRDELESWLTTGLDLVDKQLWQAWTGATWASGEEVSPLQRDGEPHQLACFLLRSRRAESG